MNKEIVKMKKKNRKFFNARMQGHNTLYNSESCEFPSELILTTGKDGFVLGADYWFHISPIFQTRIGIPKGEEGNIAVIGGNGSGKSASIAKPTLLTWNGPMCVTDIKGELSECYAKYYKEGRDRPFIIFDPTNINSLSYDPYDLLLHDDESELLGNIRDIASVIIPVRPENREPFWEDTERNVLEAAICHYFYLGLSFSQTICRILKMDVESLCNEIKEHNLGSASMFAGSINNLNKKEIASIETGLRNKLLDFADNNILQAFSGTQEGANCFSWKDLEHSNVFIKIPEYQLERWGRAVNLIYSQLIHYLSRRPEKHSEAGRNIEPTLLLMDEFPRFGKLNAIIPAITTLRSKNVNICLMVQSLAQLDMIYGQDGRRVILDNCQYKAILQANDADTQRYLSEIIGTDIVLRDSISHNVDDKFRILGTSVQTNLIREARIQPHELSEETNVIAVTPYGSLHFGKIRHNINEYISNFMQYKIDAETISAKPESSGAQMALNQINTESRTKEKTIMTIEQRTEIANQRAEKALLDARVKQRTERENLKKRNSRIFYGVGERVCKYFPQLMEIEPGTNEENETRFEKLDNVLMRLSENKMYEDLLIDATEKPTQDNHCVCGQKEGTQGRKIKPRKAKTPLIFYERMLRGVSINV